MSASSAAPNAPDSKPSPKYLTTASADSTEQTLSESSGEASTTAPFRGPSLTRCHIIAGILILVVAMGLLLTTPEEPSLKLAELLRAYTDDPKFRAAVERLGELRAHSLGLVTGAADGPALRPGELLRRAGHSFKFPVVLIPGITSATLELWEGRECAKKGFRDVYWGGTHMVGLAFRNHTCWLEHLMLDTETWGDPEGIKMRASSSFSATDYLFPGYWVWGKLIQNLADVGYDPSNMAMMSYDWRLSPQMLEERDGYFSSLKNQIELLVRRNNRRVALVVHSMGNLWVHFFFNMMERAEPGWTEKYVVKHINIAGPLLGVPKALGATLSGEMKDIADIGQLGKSIMAQFYTNEDIIRCFRSIGSLPAMFPVGGDAVWNYADNREMVTFSKVSLPNEGTTDRNMSENVECDTSSNATSTPHPFKELVTETIVGRNRSADEVLQLLEKVAPKYMNLAGKHYSIKDGRLEGDLSDNRTWASPLLSPLPPGGHLEITCMYGLINDSYSTEVGYQYRHQYPLSLDTEVSIPEIGLKNGVWHGVGDGSVPIESLGYICGGPWRNKDKRLNPSGHKVVVREYAHEPVALWETGGDLRGGEYAASHVEILGNKEIMTDVIKLVTEIEPGVEEGSAPLGDRVFSSLWEMIASIDKKRKG